MATPGGKPGYVRVNDVRMASAGKENGDANFKALFTGKAGKGHVTETAGVRGLVGKQNVLDELTELIEGISNFGAL